MSWIGETDLSKVPVEELKTMRDAGECVRECYRVLKRTNDSIVSEYLKRHAALHANNQNFVAPVIDPKTNSQYWFHTDAAEAQPYETGHFHTFVQPRKIPQVGVPAPADRASWSPDATGETLCHIIAIAMDRTGFPVRLFAPNKWVTGGIWHKAADVCHHLPYFTIDHAEPSYPVNVWITNMLVLFRPQIRQILAERDSIIATRRRQRPEEDVLEDRELAVAVDQTIDVVRQLNAVREALRVRTGSTRRTVPRMKPAAVALTADARPEQPAAPPPIEREKIRTREQAVEAALQTQIQTLHNSVLSAKTTAHALEEQVEAARQQAWQREKEHERELAELRETQRSDQARQLTETKNHLRTEFRKKLASMHAEWHAKAAARLKSARQETQNMVAAARTAAIGELRTDWEAESQKVIAEIIDLRKTEEAKRLTAAKEKWAVAGREAVAERDRIWQVAFEHQVDSALVAWRDDEEARFAQAKSAWIAERSFRDARRRKIGLWVRRIGGALLLAAVIGGGTALYPTAKRVVGEMWDDIVIANWTALKTGISASIYAPEEPAQFESDASAGPDTDPLNLAVPLTFIKPAAANLRSGPSRAANVIGILRKSAHVSRLERRGQWVRVRVAGSSGQVGWIHVSLLVDQPAR